MYLPRESESIHAGKNLHESVLFPYMNACNIFNSSPSQADYLDELCRGIQDYKVAFF